MIDRRTHRVLWVPESARVPCTILDKSDGKYHVVISDTLDELAGPFDSFKEAKKKEEKCKYFMMASDRKVEKRSWINTPQIKEFPDYCACDPKVNAFGEPSKGGDKCYTCGKYVAVKCGVENATQAP